MWAAAVIFAAHASPIERKVALRCSISCLLGCIAYNAAWFPPYPQIMLGVRSTFYFASISVVVGGYCFEKSLGRFWGFPLFLLFILDICCHISRSFDAVRFAAYSYTVDAIGYLQIAIFLYIGGNGVRNRIANFACNVSNGLGENKTA